LGYINLSLSQTIGPQWATSLKVKMASLMVNSGSMHISRTPCNIDTPTLLNSLVKLQNHPSRQKNIGDFFTISLSQFKTTTDKEISHTKITKPHIKSK
jgi:hypothetical protein